MKTIQLKLSEPSCDVLINIGGGNRSRGAEELVAFFLDKAKGGDHDAQSLWLGAIAEAYGTFIGAYLANPTRFPDAVGDKIKADLASIGLGIDDLKVFLDKA